MYHELKWENEILRNAEMFHALESFPVGSVWAQRQILTPISNKWVHIASAFCTITVKTWMCLYCNRGIIDLNILNHFFYLMEKIFFKVLFPPNRHIYNSVKTGILKDRKKNNFWKGKFSCRNNTPMAQLKDKTLRVIGVCFYRKGTGRETPTKRLTLRPQNSHSHHGLPLRNDKGRFPQSQGTNDNFLTWCAVSEHEYIKYNTLYWRDVLRMLFYIILSTYRQPPRNSPVTLSSFESQVMSIVEMC